MMNVQQIIELIKTQKKPFLNLKFKNGFDLINAGTYNNENVEKESDIDTQVNAAIQWLMKLLEIYPQDRVYYLYMRTSANVNGSGIYGPFEFTIGNVPDEKKALEGFPAQNTPPAGYIHESEMKAALLQKELEFQREREAEKMETLKREFNDKIEAAVQTAKEWNPQMLTGLASAIGKLMGRDIGTDNALSGKEPTIKELAAKDLTEIIIKNYDLESIEKLKQTLSKPPKQETE